MGDDEIETVDEEEEEGAGIELEKDVGSPGSPRRLKGWGATRAALADDGDGETC